MPKKHPKPKKTSAMPLVVAVMLFAAALAVALIYRGSDEPASTVQAPVTTGPAPSTPAPPPGERVPPPSLSMNAGWPADLPPLPAINFPPPRPRDVVQAVYQFAVRHPEVLDYVPCFCGCEHSGHTDNTDCFVKSRDLSGRITWDDHGLT